MLFCLEKDNYLQQGFIYGVCKKCGSRRHITANCPKK